MFIILRITGHVIMHFDLLPNKRKVWTRFTCDDIFIISQEVKDSVLKARKPVGKLNP
jgi:hypothetical protein